ncbi:MAG: hypothetical protein ACOH19_09845 [Rhodoglobus sp.]
MTSPYQPAPQDPTAAPSAEAQGSGYLQSADAGQVPPMGPIPVPAPVYRYPASTLYAGIRGAMGGVLLLTAGFTGLYGSRFPYNAPIEQFMNFGLILVLAAAGLTLIIFAVLASRKMSRPTVPGRTSPLAITGLVLTSVGVLAWLAFSLVPSLGALAEGERLRYMTLAAGPFFLGFVWSTGLVMGTMALRAVGGATRILSILAVVLGMIVVVATVVPAVLYGMALTD